MENRKQPTYIHKPQLPRLILCIIPLFFLVFLSCRTQKQLQYLQGPIDTAALSKINIPEPVIQKGDLIGITVFSDNAEATLVYNQQMNNIALSSSAQTTIAGNAGGLNSAAASIPSYLVDNNGDIRFQSLGNLHVEGMTKPELEKYLNNKLTVFLKNPYCNIRFLNYKFTILGEVARQGIYAIPNEKINILEALGMAGDLTLYAIKDSIMIVREENNKRSFAYLNVSKPEVMLSPYYNIKQNDIIIVKANSKKPGISDQEASQRFTRVATIVSVVTSLIVALNLFIRR